MTRRVVTVGVTASTPVKSTTFVMCPDCHILVELNGEVFKRHGISDVLCARSGKYPPEFATNKSAAER